jgi:hypothetical protein
MDCVREWRDGRNRAAAQAGRRDALKAAAVSKRVWEHVPTTHQIVSVGGTLSLSALDQAFAAIETEFPSGPCDELPVVEVVIVSGLRHADIRAWGRYVYEEFPADVKRERGAYGEIHGATVYMDNSVPRDTVLVGSLPAGKWDGAFSTVTVVVGS